MGKVSEGWETTKPVRKRLRVPVVISVSPAWLATINAKVPGGKRSQFLALAGFLALADTSELRQRYRSALDILLGRLRV